MPVPAPGWACRSATELASQRGDGGHDPLAQRRDVLVGEGLLARAEAQRERQRTPPGADLLAAVDVENARLAQRLAGGGPHRLEQPRGAELLGERDRDVLAQLRVGAEGREQD